MANENHGSSREDAALMSHSPGTSHQNQPSSPKPVRLVQDLPGNGGGGPCACGRAGGGFSPPLMSFLPSLLSPDELVQAGWEKCWSKRESRPYYFNRFTNQSLWEMPLLGQHDVIVSSWEAAGGGREASGSPSLGGFFACTSKLVAGRVIRRSC